MILPQVTNWTHALGTALHNDAIANADLHYIIYGLILVLVMLFRPEGLIASASRRAELHHAEVSKSAAAAGADR